MSEFNYEIEMAVRFRDLDPMGHVNNAVYATYLEQARVRYVQDVVGKEVMDTGAVVADLNMEFKRPVTYEDSVTVAVRSGDLGTTSIPVEYEIRANGSVAATAETTMVTYDREADEPQPIPEEWRNAIEEFEGD